MKCVDCGKNLNITKERYHQQRGRCSHCFKFVKKVAAAYERKARLYR